LRYVDVGIDRVDARERQRSRRIDRMEKGVPMRRANEGDLKHAGEVDIVDISAFAGQQRQVLEAPVPRFV
jgi:hypothetical protein